MATDTSDGLAPAGRHSRTITVIVQVDDAQDEQFRAAVEHVRHRGHDVRVRVTWELADVRRFVDEARHDGVDVVVAAGGDGMVHHVVNDLVQPDMSPALAFGIVPLGTGNDLATCSGFDCADPMAALLMAAEGKPALLDVVAMDHRLMLNVATAGPGAEITEQTPPALKQMLGKLAYAVSGVQQLTSGEPEYATVRAPGLDWEGEFLVLAIGNGRLAGGGMQLCPRAVLDDGLLDVLIVPAMPQLQFLTLLAAMRRGTHLESSDVIYRQLPWIELTAPHPIQINLDGEPNQVQRTTFRVHPRVLPAHIPLTAPLLASGASTDKPILAALQGGDVDG